MTHDLLVMHVITTVAGFVTVLTVQAFAWLREARRHRWQQEENRQMRAAVDAVTTEVKNGNGNGKSHD